MPHLDGHPSEEVEPLAKLFDFSVAQGLAGRSEEGAAGFDRKRVSLRRIHRVGAAVLAGRA